MNPVNTRVQIIQPNKAVIYGKLVLISPHTLTVQVGQRVYHYDRMKATQNRAGEWVIQALPVVGSIQKTASLP